MRSAGFLARCMLFSVRKTLSDRSACSVVLIVASLVIATPAAAKAAPRNSAGDLKTTGSRALPHSAAFGPRKKPNSMRTCQAQDTDGKSTPGKVPALKAARHFVVVACEQPPKSNLSVPGLNTGTFALLG